MPALTTAETSRRDPRRQPIFGRRRSRTGRRVALGAALGVAALVLLAGSGDDRDRGAPAGHGALGPHAGMSDGYD